MKKLITILFISFSFINNSFCQKYVYEQKDNLKKGIYKNFEEFQRNSPSLPLDYTYEIKSIGYGFLNLSGQVQFARIIIEKHQRKAIGTIYGFCDGQNIYISAENKTGVKLKNKTLFNHVKYLGRYACYEAISYGSTPNGGTTRSLSKRIVNVHNGMFYYLTKKNLRAILAQDESLLKQFERETQKRKVLKEYIIKFCEKNY